jgi:hypothetical protein
MSSPPWGHVAEWLRNGLQNRVHQFNSGRGLQPILLIFPNNLIPYLFRKKGLLPLCYHSHFFFDFFGPVGPAKGLDFLHHDRAIVRAVAGVDCPAVCFNPAMGADARASARVPNPSSNRRAGERMVRESEGVTVEQAEIMLAQAREKFDGLTCSAVTRFSFHGQPFREPMRCLGASRRHRDCHPLALQGAEEAHRELPVAHLKGLEPLQSKRQRRTKPFRQSNTKSPGLCKSMSPLQQNC